MRLTLRTLLAYQDDVLEPADMDEIRQKVESGEFASSLAGRIHDVTRRLRLRAPKVVGRGMGLDPNTVAEYLDNTLAAERVPNFEKVCLESDVHLAEVAACHQILTLVLGEPADVVSESRQRMYNILRENPATATYEMKPQPAAEVSRHQPPPRTERENPRIPEYLRDESSSRGKLMSLAVLLLLVTSLGVVAYLTVRPESLAFFGAGKADPAAVEANSGADKVANPADADLPDVLDDPADQEPVVPIVVPPTEEEGEPSSEPMVESESSARPAPVDPDDRQPEPEAPVPTRPEPSVPDDEPPADMPEPDTSPETELPPSPEDEPDDPVVPEPNEPPPAGPLGRYLAEPGVLLGLNDQGNGLVRMNPNGDISAGELLTSLPTYRSVIELSGGLMLTLLGDTGLQVDRVEEDLVMLTLNYGRVVIAVSPGNANPARVELRLPAHEGTLRLTGPDAAAAVEVRPYRIEGTDPEGEPPQVDTTLFAVSGQISWDESGQAAGKAIQAPAVWDLSGDPEAMWHVDTPQPTWVGGIEEMTDFDRLASEALLEELRPDRAIRLNLMELALHRRIEVRSLAVRCLASLGEFEPIIQAIHSHPGPEPVWSGHVATLRSAMAIGPKMAALVRATLQQHRREGAADLYRLLWGYSNDQLEQGEDGRLVEYLDHPDLDIRVLAFWNLKEITGAGLSYRPGTTPARRQKPTQRWRLKLEAGNIRRNPDSM